MILDHDKKVLYVFREKQKVQLLYAFGHHRSFIIPNKGEGKEVKKNKFIFRMKNPSFYLPLR